jgi:hypothetical protein
MANLARLIYVMVAVTALTFHTVALVQAVRYRHRLAMPGAMLSLLVTTCISLSSVIYFRIQAAVQGAPIDSRFYATGVVVLSSLVAGYLSNREVARLSHEPWRSGDEA